MKRQSKLAVVGIGNELCKDDGFGIVALKKLQEIGFDSGTLVEGATYGISLLPLFFEYEKIIFMDIIKVDDTPGSIYVIPLDSMENKTFLTVSLHDTGVHETYIQAKIFGSKAECYLVGIVPYDFRGYGDITEELKKRVDTFINEVIKLSRKIADRDL